ncbi:PadR family transcriptional regulator [Clostridium paraputrificum]|uniref:PadR family transcriptional regulator n=1 Tax=Clostridium TaxID=1485 RepID=UPI003D3278F9
MELKKVLKTYLPMTETMYYILLSLKEKRHGYGIMLHVEEITNKRIKIGAGTIYNSLSKLEKDKLILVVEEQERRKIYEITELGREVLKREITRLEELLNNGKV